MRVRPKTRRMSRGSFRRLQGARLDLIFRHAIEAQHLTIALEAVRTHCRLHGIQIDGPDQTAPLLTPETWQRLLADAEKRRVS